DHVGGVEPSTEPDLDHRHLHAVLREGEEAHQRGQLEEGEPIVAQRPGHAPGDLREQRRGAILGDRLARHPDPLAEMEEVRRGVQPGSQPGRAEGGLGEGAGGPLSIAARGVARMTSPWKAKEAATPPVVGSSSTLMYGCRTCRNRARAALLFAICISEKIASCIRAPPEAEKMMAGMRRSVARSKMRVTFSPTTEPIDPPMNPKWKAP